MLSNRLKQLREDCGLNQNELAKKLSVSASAIGMYETGKREPNNELLIKIADYFDVTLDYLLGKSNNKYNSEDTSKTQYYMCPVYGKISAGQPNWAEECIEGTLPIDPELMGIIRPEEHYFLRVNGESMNKVVKNGAYALIHKQDYVENGEIAVVLVNGDSATLKIFNKQDDVVVLSPNSTENEFKQQIYTKETPIIIIGKYIGKMEFNN